MEDKKVKTGPVQFDVGGVQRTMQKLFDAGYPTVYLVYIPGPATYWYYDRDSAVEKARDYAASPAGQGFAMVFELLATAERAAPPVRVTYHTIP